MKDREVAGCPAVNRPWPLPYCAENWRVDERDLRLSLAYELSAQDQAFDRIVAAVNLLWGVREPDRADDCALFQRLPGPLDL